MPFGRNYCIFVALKKSLFVLQFIFIRKITRQRMSFRFQLFQVTYLFLYKNGIKKGAVTFAVFQRLLHAEKPMPTFWVNITTIKSLTILMICKQVSLYILLHILSPLHLINPIVSSVWFVESLIICQWEGRARAFGDSSISQKNTHQLVTFRASCNHSVQIPL